MKNLLFCLLFMFGAITASAQHAPQFTNYMVNKMAYNPAYAGSQGALDVQALFRKQWVGIDGAPSTSIVNVHTPFFRDRCGIGLSIMNDRIGNTNSTYLDLQYNYRFPVADQTTLNIGVSGRLEHSKVDWSNSMVYDMNDAFIPESTAGTYQPNFGTGVYLQHQKYYLGLSVPRILKSSLYQIEDSNSSNYKRMRNYYLMGGADLEINSKLHFIPSFLLSYNPNAPFEMEFGGGLQIMNAFLIGASYRLGDSVDAYCQFQVTQQLKLGVGLDFTMTELQEYSNGSFEVLAEYLFDMKNSQVHNLRFF